MSKIIKESDYSKDSISPHISHHNLATVASPVTQDIFMSVEEDSLYLQSLHLSPGVMLQTFSYLDSSGTSQTYTFVGSAPLTFTSFGTQAPVVVDPVAGTISYNDIADEAGVGVLDTFHFTVSGDSTTHSIFVNIVPDTAVQLTYILKDANGMQLPNSVTPLTHNVHEVDFTLSRYEPLDVDLGIALLSNKSAHGGDLVLTSFLQNGNPTLATIQYTVPDKNDGKNDSFQYTATDSAHGSYVTTVHLIQNGNHPDVGTTGADIFIGGTGTQFINGDGGPDTIIGGPGNDTIIVGDSAFARIDGGADINNAENILAFNGSGDLDLAQHFWYGGTLGDRIHDIQQIDLGSKSTLDPSNPITIISHNQPNQLILNMADVLEINPSQPTLFVNGDALDSVKFADLNWVDTHTTVNKSGVTYEHYINGPASVNIEVHMHVFM